MCKHAFTHSVYSHIVLLTAHAFVQTLCVLTLTGGYSCASIKQVYVSGAVLTYRCIFVIYLQVDLYAGDVFMKEALGWDIYPSTITLLIITGIYTITGKICSMVLRFCTIVSPSPCSILVYMYVCVWYRQQESGLVSGEFPCLKKTSTNIIVPDYF